jgi:hypothetical protein
MANASGTFLPYPRDQRIYCCFVELQRCCQLCSPSFPREGVPHPLTFFSSQIWQCVPM